MFDLERKSKRGGKVAVALVLLLALALPVAAKKKKDPLPAGTAAPAAKPIDPTFIVFPPPPDIARIRYMNYFAGQKIENPKTEKVKLGWMDRLAGVEPGNDKGQRRLPPQLIRPLGMTVDSQGRLYVADQKAGGIFIFNTETREVQYIRNGHEAHFSLINCLAIDDNDRLFVSDGQLRHVLVFNTQHKVEDVIQEGMVDPVGLAIDAENRFLYVVDSGLDQVLVYDADSFKLLRKIGTAGHNHELTGPGDFGAPHGVAVDKEGYVYVTDMLNDRVEVFDADGAFVRTWGKNGDGPGEFARPKGIAVDADGHVWVVDAMLDRVRVFDHEGDLLIQFGGHGTSPGQFKSLAGITIDKHNRVFTSEQFPGRVQMFRYVTEAEAQAEFDRRQKEREERATARGGAQKNGAPVAKPAEAAGQKDGAQK